MADFNLRKITIRNFRSIHKVDLEIRDGLYSITGVNRDQPGTFNGAGKSTIVYALWWCLTGNSLEGEGMADDVINIQEGKNCKVECHFETDAGDVTIMRCRKDSEHGNNLFLTINGQDLSCHKIADTQDRINQLLKVSFDILKSTIILTSDIKSCFSKLTGSARIALLESIRDYTIWQKVRDESNKDIGSFDSQINAKTAENHQLSGTEIAYNNMIADLRTKYLEEKTRLATINYEQDKINLKNEIESAKKQLISLDGTAATEEMSKLLSEKEDLIKKSEESVYLLGKIKDEINAKYQQQTKDLNQKVADVNNLIYSNNQEVYQHKLAQQTLKNEIEIIDQWFVKDTCPTCNRKLDRTEQEMVAKTQQKASKQEEADKVEAKIAEITLKNDTLESEKQKCREDVDKIEKSRQEEIIAAENTHNEGNKNLKEQIAALSDKIAEKKNAVDGVVSEKNRLDNIITQCTTKLAQIAEQEANATNRLQEIQDQAKEYQDKITEIGKQKEANQKEIDVLEKKKKYAKFYYDSLGPRGNFRGILLSQDIAYINHCLKGYINKFFSNTTVYLTTPNMDKNQIDIVFETNGIVKPVGNLSGGERKRLDLAIQLSIYNLIQSTSMFNFNICVFDEIESALDPAGVEQLLEVIAERSEDTPTTWWITNNDMVSTGIVNRIQAEKIDGFTKVRYL
jgi:DNA repair exonuclease SbcCD ATPase subunit